MRKELAVLAVFVIGVAAAAQVAAPAPAADPLWQQLAQAGQTADADLEQLRIDRWKADSSARDQSQRDADSLRRNLRQALPGLIQAAQAAPGDLAPQFKLYRNLNALYDVMAGLTNSAGAYGRGDDYEVLAADAQRLDTLRRQLADRLETMTARYDAELTRLKAAQQQAAAAAAAQPVKKIVVDEERPAAKKKARRKTTDAKPTPAPK